MRVVSVLAVAVALAASAAGAPLTFPATPAGRHAQAFFPAFNSDSEDDLSRFLEAHISEAGRQRRSVAERLAVLRAVREAHGRLTPAALLESTDTLVELEVLGERGGSIALALLCEPAAPHALAGFRIKDQGDQPDAAEAAPGPPMSEAELVTALKEHLAAEAQAGRFSGAALLAKGDTLLWRAAYGLASRQPDVPNRPETRFNLGSINKLFTRIAIEQLAAAGTLALSDTLERHVPAYPAAKARQITLRQLLEHRGGTGELFGPRYDSYDRDRLRTLQDWLPLVTEEPLQFAPGTREEYSNAGYLLLGLVIEKASAQSYEDYVRQHIFIPAGMASTDAYPKHTQGLARGYLPSGVPNTDGLPWRGSSAGGGYSTVDDMLRLAQALRSGKLGAQVAGLGIAGGSPGVNAAFELLGDYTLVLLANQSPPAAESVATRLRGWLRRAGAAGGERRIVRQGGSPEDDAGHPRRSSLPAGGVSVPMRRSGHMPAVHVLLNGLGPFLFGIDTGGAGTARVDRALAQRLGLATVGEVRAGDPSGRNERTLPLVALDSIEIAGARFEGLVAAVRDFNDGPPGEALDGVLGFGLFADCLLTLDYPGLQVRLRQGELPPENGRDVLGFRDGHGIPSITVQVAGRELEADVDAGAMGGIILPEAEAAKLPLEAPPKVVGRARTVSNSFEIKAAPLAGDVTIGAFVLSRPRVEFQPLFPSANIGARVLRDFVLTFDQKNHRLQLAKPDPRP